MRRQKSLKEERIEEEINMGTIVPGDATNFPKTGDSVLVHYIGYLEDGTMFDNSYNRQRPLCFVVGKGQVIQGWDDIITKMSRGQKARFVFPPKLAYGDRGYPPVIPPMATLTFEIELVSFSSQSTREMLQRDV